MGRTIFRVLHNMLPVWIFLLKALKKAPKALPSVRDQRLLFSSLQCGKIQTDSFSYDRSGFRPLCCTKAETDSFRGAAAAATICWHETSGVFNMSDDSATSASEATHQISHTGLEEDASSTICNSEYSDRVTLPSAEIGDFQEIQTEIKFSAPQENTPSSDGLDINDFLENEKLKCDVAKNAKYGRSAKMPKRGQFSSSSPKATETKRSVRRSAAVVKDSHDPYFDFVYSMTEMIITNGLSWDSRDLEELLLCYLHLNSPNHHSLIKVAFLDVLTWLNSRQLLRM